MFDPRLINLQKAGYGTARIDQIARLLSEEAFDAISETKTPQEALRVMNEHLAIAKVSTEELDEEE